MKKLKFYTQTEINSRIIIDIRDSVLKDLSHFDIFCELLHCHCEELTRDTLKKMKGMYVLNISVTHVKSSFALCV